MASDIDICTAALFKIGGSPIQSFADNSKEAQVAAVLYPQIKQSELANYPWQFAGFKIELNRTTEKPIDPQYKFAYQLPPDQLNIRSAFNAGGVATPYYIENDTLYCSLTRVFIEYTRDLPELDMPAYFIDVLIARCAFEFAVPIIGLAGDTERAEKEYSMKAKEAKRIDANINEPQRLITPANSSVVRARMGYWPY